MNRCMMIVDGPAGAGKSTLIDRLLQAEHTPFMGAQAIAELPRPRAYPGEGLGQLKQTNNILSALYSDSSSGHIPLIDRGYASAIIYASIRNNIAYINYRAALQNYIALTRALISQYQTVNGQWPNGDVFDIYEVAICPSEQLLMANREKANRPFPYSEDQAIFRQYGSMIEYSTFYSVSHRVNYHRKAYAVDAVEGLDNVYKAVYNWGLNIRANFSA